MDNYLDLDAAFDEIRWLYKEYGITSDRNLSESAKELRQHILQFINRINRRCLSATWDGDKCEGYYDEYLYYYEYYEEPAKKCKQCKYFMEK